jgi:hypothetical protein
METVLPSEDLRYLYTSLNTVSAIRSGLKRWAGHVARVGRLGSLLWVETFEKLVVAYLIVEFFSLN